MKRHRKYIFALYLTALIAAFNFSSCTEEKDVIEPIFDVAVEKTTIAAGETLKFNFTGTADLISFYSGEPGREYRYRERSQVLGKPQLTFTSNRRFGSGTIASDTTLKVLISTDYKGALNAAEVNSATWTDISNRAVLSKNLGGGTTQTASGVIDLSDFYISDVPVYIAFKFHDFQSALSQRTWNIKEIAINNKQADGSLVSVANIGNLAWGALSVMGSQQWTTNTTQIEIAGGAANTPENIDWLITQPLHLDRVQRDFGLNAKGNPVTKQTGYEYAFAKPGTYTVTFEAINASRWDKKTITKEFTIIVQ